MRVWVTRSCRHMARVIWLVVITSLVPLTAVASGTAGAKPTPTLKTSAAEMAVREVAAASPVRPLRVREDRQGTASTNSTSFFKTRPGIIALVAMAAGTGYALYSAQHDRIHSPGKK